MSRPYALLIVQRQSSLPPEQLDDMEKAALQAQTAVVMKTNRYDAATGTLHLTAPEAAAYHRQVGYWADYFTASARNGGLKPDLITDPVELHQFAAFVGWAAHESP